MDSVGVRKLAKRVRRVTFQLERAYLGNTWQQGRESTYYLGSLVVELDNLIVDSLRGYCLFSLMEIQKRTRLHSNAISPLRGEENFSDLLIEKLASRRYQNRKPGKTFTRRDEPTIRLPTKYINIFTGCGVAVPGGYGNAVALNYTVFSEIKDFRHYYAHRNNATFNEVKNKSPVLRRGIVRSPDELLHYSPTHAGPLIIQWLGEVHTFFSIATDY